MTYAESILFLITIGLYLVSMLWLAGGFVFNREKLINFFAVPVLAALAVHTAVIIVRWRATGHGPVMKDYENALLGAWLMVVLYLLLVLKRRGTAVIGIVIMPLAMLLLGYALMTKPVLERLSPGYKSFWLYVHVFTAWLAFGAYAIASGFAVAFFIRGRYDGQSVRTKIPEQPSLDLTAFRIVLFGFILHTVMIAAGSIWAANLWGSYWSWDPIETWSLISWLCYGIIIHLRMAFAWKNRKFAVMIILALATVIIAWLGINWIPSSQHVFSTLE